MHISLYEVTCGQPGCFQILNTSEPQVRVRVSLIKRDTQTNFSSESQPKFIIHLLLWITWLVVDSIRDLKAAWRASSHSLRRIAW